MARPIPDQHNGPELLVLPGNNLEVAAVLVAYLRQFGDDPVEVGRRDVASVDNCEAFRIGELTCRFLPSHRTACE